MKKLTIAFAAAATLVTGAAPAAAHGRDHRDRYESRYDRGNYGRYDSYRGYNQGYDRAYYGDQRRAYRCNSGTTGLIVGGVAGGLLGREVVRRDRTAGAIIGGAVGALAGRQLERAGSNNRC